MKSGIYNYFLNGEPTGVSETFDIKFLPDGSKITTSIRYAKPFNTTIKVETVGRNNKLQTSKIIYQNNEINVEAIYAFSENSLQISRKLDGKTIQNESIDLSENAVFFSLMRCFQGQIILQVAENVDVTNVLVPDIQLPTDSKNLLRPTFDKRIAKLITTKDKLRVFNYLSKHYDENSEFHIDEKGLLVYYKFVQNESQTWEITLTY